MKTPVEVNPDAPSTLYQRVRERLGGIGPKASSTRIPTISFGILVLVVGVSLFGQYTAPYSPTSNDLPNRMMPPFFMKGGSVSHFLGTDQLGRDILSRIIMGSRVSMSVALVALALAGIAGVIVGLSAAFLVGWVGAVLMRIVDIVLPIPMIVVGLLMAILFGPTFLNVVIAIAIIASARYARIIRGEALSLMSRDFIAQARIVGCSPARIIFRHLLPNVLNTIIVMVTLQVGWSIMVESSLSFLGAGIPPPAPSWGRMVADGRDYIGDAWWLSGFPGLAIFMTVISLNLVGDWLRDRLDPKLRQL